MKSTEKYVDLDGNEICLTGLDIEERRFLSRLRRRAAGNPDWDDFDNFGYEAVRSFYESRGLANPKVKKTALFKILQDLSARLGIAQGFIRPPDYLGQLENLVLNHFPSRRAFCRASGISQTTLNQILAGRKDLSVQSFSKALERIGYRLRIVPVGRAKRTG